MITFIPERYAIKLDLGLDEKAYSVDDHPATQNWRKYQAVDASRGWSYLFAQMLAIDESMVNLTSSPTPSLFTPLPTAAPTSSWNQNNIFYTLNLFYLHNQPHGSMLQPGIIENIRKYEMKLQTMAEYGPGICAVDTDGGKYRWQHVHDGKTCPLQPKLSPHAPSCGREQCQPPDSLLNFFYPTILHGWRRLYPLHRHAAGPTAGRTFCSVAAAAGAQKKQQMACGKYGSVAGCAKMCRSFNWCNSFIMLESNFACCMTEAHASSYTISNISHPDHADARACSEVYADDSSTSSTDQSSSTQAQFGLNGNVNVNSQIGFSDAIISFDGHASEVELETVWSFLADSRHQIDYFGKVVSS
jgi:hypothetical protein